MTCHTSYGGLLHANELLLNITKPACVPPPLHEIMKTVRLTLITYFVQMFRLTDVLSNIALWLLGKEINPIEVSSGHFDSA